jgi:UDP-N-acetylmuramyl pentapeptide phosphotransferase/UDP-N-acetylglucosamine-1-phosphate transferase
MHLIYKALAAGLLSWGLTGLVLSVAQRTSLVAEPTSRGLHKVATPVGGGLGMLAAALIVWLIDAPVGSTTLGAAVLAALVLLAVVSWIDDRRPLPPAVRFPLQAVVVGMLLWLLPSGVRLVAALPLEAERVLLAIAWLWVVNLTNFMDGIDGLAGTEAVAVGAGYALVVSLAPGGAPLLAHLPDLALVLAAAAAGYLVWNWAPARIFMGDVGSIPLGLLFGLLMFDLASRGQWAAALILPLYFLLDATTTLLDRLRRGLKPWQAHREHAYQRAVLAGLGHAAVTLHVAALNVMLVALAVVSVRYPVPAVAAALLVTSGLVVWFRARQDAAKPAPR